jgi:hypothetical protein
MMSTYVRNSFLEEQVFVFEQSDKESTWRVHDSHMRNAMYGGDLELQILH